MKNRGMILAICLIIAVGIGSTAYTSQMIHKKSSAIAMEEQRTVEEEMAAAAEAQEAYLEEQTSETQKEEGSELAKEETLAGSNKSTVLISPLSGSLESILPDGSSSALTESKTDYYTRLNEIDSQILKMRSEENVSSTYSVKNAAEFELRLWDSALSDIYNVLMEKMNEEEKADLKKDELSWLQERDAAAKEAANKYNGGVLEGVEYTAAMASSTRDRAYDLVAQYEELLKAD